MHPLLKILLWVSSHQGNKSQSPLRYVTSPLCPRLPQRVQAHSACESHTRLLAASPTSRSVLAPGPLHYCSLCLELSSFRRLGRHSLISFKFLFRCLLLSKVFPITPLKTTDGPISHTCPSRFLFSRLYHLLTSHSIKLFLVP